MSLSVDADVSDSVDLFGKVASDLQNDIVIGEDSITGTLKYVTDYTGFDSDPSLQSGNYIVLHMTVPGYEDSATIEVTVTNPVVLDEDGIVVLRIADKDSQTITVVASVEGLGNTTTVFALDGLTCEES